MPLKNIITTVVLLLSSVQCLLALEIGSYGQHWSEIKYGQLSKEEKIKAFDSWIASATPKNQDEQIWIALAKCSQAGLIGGIDAAGKIAAVLSELKPIIDNPRTELDYVACAMSGYLYAKLPGWPISVGSKTKASRYLQKAQVKKESPDVAFYLAQGYLMLGKKKEAKLAFTTALDGFNKEQTLYAQGKKAELNLIKKELVL